MSRSTYETFYTQLAMRNDLPALSPRMAHDIELSDRIMRSGLSEAVVCGLLLLNDDYQTAHPIAQGLEGNDGSYWHGIIHRIESDYWNAKYWFKRIGEHALLTEMAQLPEAKSFVVNGKWSPLAFVDGCERSVQQKLDGTQLRQLQLAEIKMLLVHCRRGQM